MLEHPEVKIATRNMFYDEQGKHRRTKKEILDEQGNLRAGCSIIPKGEVYESHIFTKKDEWFKSDAFTREVKEMFTEIINSHVKDESEKAKSYLYSIAGNIIKNYYKKKKEILLDQLPDIEKDNLTEIEIRLDVERALDLLPEEIKETAILFFFQGLKQKEISDLLHIKLSLVKYRVSKAKELLSKQLEEGRD